MLSAANVEDEAQIEAETETEDQEQEEEKQYAEEATTENTEDTKEEKPEPQPEPVLPAVDEAQAEWEVRRIHLEREIANEAIQQVRLKAAIKINRESLKDLTEDLERHLLRGPDRRPIFSEIEANQAAACQAETETPAPATLEHSPDPPQPDEESTPPEAVDVIKLRIRNRIVTNDENGAEIEFAQADTIVWGFLNELGDPFLAKRADWRPPEADPWITAFLEDGEFETIEEPMPVSDPDPDFDPDAWRARKIDDLPGLTPKIVEILEGHDIRTLGDWVDVPTKRGIEYTQLKGITEARFSKIQEAMMRATT